MTRHLRYVRKAAPVVLGAAWLTFSVSLWGSEGRSVGGESSTPPESGVIVDTIEIDNRNIFETSLPEYDQFLFRIANRLHWKTHPNVIRREVLIREGEPFSVELAEETTRNLRRRLQLYDAWIQTETLPDGRLLMRVITIDQWSTSAVFALERSGDITNWRFGPAERNLFGRNLYATIQYAHDSQEGDYFQSAFVGDRFLGNPWRLSAVYNGDPTSRVRLFRVAHPFYNLSQTWSYGLTVRAVSGRSDFYTDSRKIGSSFHTDDAAIASLTFRTDVGAQKISTAIEYVYDHERVGEQRVLLPSDSADAWARFPDDSLYHKIMLGVASRGSKYVKLEQIDGFGYTEDFLLGMSAKATAARAFASGDVVFDEFGVGVSWRTNGGPSLFSLAVESITSVEANRVSRRLVGVSARFYNLGIPILTLAAGVDYTDDWTQDFSENLSLGGLGGGLRGFDQHFRTGNRRLIMHLEGRLYPRIQILSAYLGGTAFVDAGRTWKSSDNFELRDFYATAGVGLRISFERASKDALIRVDLGYAEETGWQISLGSGQHFHAGVGISPLTTH